MEMRPCPTCRQVTAHRPPPPDGWLRCYACMPERPVPVVVVNQVKGKSFLLHYVLPAIFLGVLFGMARLQTGC